MSRQKIEKLVVALVLLGVLGVGGVKLLRYARPSPERALHDFRERHGLRERDQRMDPLILAGRRVVPGVLRDLEEKKLPSARAAEAVRFLGNGGYAETLPLLKKVFSDSGEPHYLRAEALRAIAMIDRDLALEYAQGYMVDLSPIGYVSRDLDRGHADAFERRTYWDAFFRRTSKKR